MGNIYLFPLPREKQDYYAPPPRADASSFATIKRQVGKMPPSKASKQSRIADKGVSLGIRVFRQSL